MTKYILICMTAIVVSCQQPQMYGQQDNRTMAQADQPDNEDKVDLANGQSPYIDNDHFKYKKQEHLHNEYAIGNKGEILIYNLSGDIIITGIDGEKAVVDIDKTIYAKSESELNEAMNRIQLGDVLENESLTLYTAAPYDTRPKSREINYNQGYEERYHIDLDYTIKLPINSSVIAHTINDGSISISNINGAIVAHHVNGDILLDDIKKATTVKTVNGDIKMSFSSYEAADLDCSTINGDVHITAPSATSAEWLMKSFNGEFYTDFDDYDNINNVVKEVDTKDGKKTTKINKMEGIRVGNGTYKGRIETLNGDVYINKK